MKIRKPRRRQRLLWRLMRSYLIVTLVSVLLVELLVASLWWLAASSPAPEPARLAKDTYALTSGLTPALANTTQLSSALAGLRRDDRYNYAVSSPDGRVLASIPENWLAVSSHLPNGEFETLRAAYGKARNNEVVTGAQGEDGRTMAVVPIKSGNNPVAALLWVRVNGPIRSSDFSRALTLTVLWSGVIVGIFGTFAGAGFGWVNARRLTKRFKMISDAADAWSRGDFAAQALDKTPDEIGDLANRLNLMASQLRELVALRERVGASEERDRLSRDLHDTVKQQLFATTMQIGAARVLLDRDVEMARARLLEAERLAFGAQSELTALLEQLRPGSYQNQPAENVSLEVALGEYLRNWQTNSGIKADFSFEPLPPLPTASQQALLRIAQEALANVARHSSAKQVKLGMRTNKEQVEPNILVLTIQDNGRGFSPEAVANGLGLRTMRERAEALPDGVFQLRSVPELGTRIEVRTRIQQEHTNG